MFVDELDLTFASYGFSLFEHYLAVLYSRRGEEQKAVECYVRSCSQDPSYIHRGNLDPEIAVLIRRYGLNAAPEDEFEYSL